VVTTEAWPPFAACRAPRASHILPSTSHDQIARGGVGRSGVEVLAGGGDGAVAQGGGDEVNWGLAFEGVGGVAVPEPVGGHLGRDPGARGGRAHNAQDLARVERPAALTRAEHRRVLRRVPVPPAQRHQVLVDRRRQEDGALLGTLAPYADLPGVVRARPHVAPAQGAQLGHTDAASVEQAQQDPIARVDFQGEHALHVGLLQDARGQALAARWELEGTADVEGQVAEAVTEGEQALDGRQGPHARAGFEPGEAVGEVLQRAEREGAERRGAVGLEAGDVGAVGALGVRAASVQPERDEVLVRGGLRDRHRRWRRRGIIGRCRCRDRGGAACVRRVHGVYGVYAVSGLHRHSIGDGSAVVNAG